MTNRRSFLASLAAIAGVGAFVKKNDLAGLTTELRCPYPPKTLEFKFNGRVTGMQVWRDKLYIATEEHGDNCLYSWDGSHIEPIVRGRYSRAQVGISAWLNEPSLTP